MTGLKRLHFRKLCTWKTHGGHKRHNSSPYNMSSIWVQFRTRYVMLDEKLTNLVPKGVFWHFLDFHWISLYILTCQYIILWKTSYLNFIYDLKWANNRSVFFSFWNYSVYLNTNYDTQGRDRSKRLFHTNICLSGSQFFVVSNLFLTRKNVTREQCWKKYHWTVSNREIRTKN